MKCMEGDAANWSVVQTFTPEIARCVATREGLIQDYESTTMVAQTMQLRSVQAIGVTGTTSHALTAEGADASEDGTGRGTPVVCVHADAVGRTGDALTPSLYAAGVSRIRPPGIGVIDDGRSYNLMASGQPHAVTVAIRGRDGGATAELGGDIATALRASQGGGDKPHVLAPVGCDTYNGTVTGDVAATLGTQSGDGLSSGPSVLTSAVRRLTPMECERLQGFPDGYTAIPWRGKPADQCPDGPRYKALGNSWAVPKFTWLGRRIAQFMPAVAANDNHTSTPISANRSHA